MNETYICAKCGNSLLKSNKLLHDLHCKSDINNNNMNNFNSSNNNNVKEHFIDINEIDTYKCPICGINLSPKDKLDHMLCHQLEADNKDNEKIIINNNSGNFEFNFNSDSLNENYDRLNIRNNVNINIFNDNGNNNNRVRRNFEFNFNNRNNNLEDENFEDDLEEQEEENSLNDELDEFYADEIDNGIEDNVIETLPKSRIKDISKLTEDKKKCCICLENFKVNDETINLPCIHIFHSNCIKKWMKRQDICPICKNKIIPED